MGNTKKVSEIDPPRGFYMYVIMDPRTGEFSKNNHVWPHEPFYVGKGKGKRFKEKKNRGTEGRIRSIRESGLEPVCIVLNGFDAEDDVFQCEKTYVDMIGRACKGEGPLLNVLPGGRLSEFPKKRRKDTPHPFKGKTAADDLRIRHGFVGWRRGKTKETHPQIGGKKHLGFGKLLSEAKSLDWIVTEPDGKVIEVRNLRKYALCHGLNPTNLWHTHRTGKPFRGYMAVRKVHK